MLSELIWCYCKYYFSASYMSHKDFIKVPFSLRVDVCPLVLKKRRKKKKLSNHIIYYVNIQGDLSIVVINIVLSYISLNPNMSWVKFFTRACHCCHCYHHVFASLSGNRICGIIAQFYLIVDSSSLVEKWIFTHQML